ncbi:MAG: Spy/CpxP family protein refolding chaperone [Dysgonomonas sp.]
MKRLLLSFAILMCVSLTMTISAQETKKAGERRFPMAKELNLSADQQQKMESLHKDFGDKMKELRDNSSLTKEDKQTKLKELRDQQMAEVNKILTPEQQTKMKEFAPKRGDRNMRGKMDPRKGRDGFERGDRMKDLNLTDDQKAKIKNLNEEFRAKSKELADSHRQALDKVYTPEQQQKLKEMKKDRPGDGRFGFHGKKRGDFNLDEASKDKLKTLKENFDKEKKAVELSRIAPDAQKQKIKDLREKFVKEKRQIIEDAKKVKENKPS